MNRRPTRIGRLALVGTAAAAVSVFPAVTTATPVADAAPALVQQAPAALPAAADPADGTAEGAVEWFKSKQGDTSYEGLCEKAVENAWGTTGVWPSAIAHWQGAVDAGKAHEGDTNPPKGAFVYWNISQYGHVGIADGNGGFYSSGIDGAIGHQDSLSYFGDYLGWSDPQVPAGL
ncbi:hypothetical protein A8924_6200 [Saccharopolyspora erythraea NRRL 2338]|uniref:CHAP domain-containing protein n=1 Tax=Saccharopolyspora erythraea TaxID=1836 RepID=A0ABP3M3Z0_SACER|nr:hypothetical protein [Saccharopolyspora erythraea]PFG98679.1 hypothetical protein A8924_6200 [Saccharopolyspora erythraea NRRL 2338]QRK88697.1 CHAP domain-containing protein [Saccharopolyspora erythraea]